MCMAEIEMIGTPSPRRIWLRDGSFVDVWAHSITGLSGPEDTRDYELHCLMNIDPAIQGQFDVTARTPSNPWRVLVMVARFPRTAVIDVTSTEASAPG
jgi:hypothetical protein